MSDQHRKLLIIGSGPAGFTAAIYGTRALLAPCLISGLQTGGQLTITTDVENYPGFADVIQGPWLMQQMEAQARQLGCELVSDTVTKLDLSQRPFRAETDGGALWSADAVILATGARAKWLGVPGEQEFMGFGVSACATCDGFFFKDKNVAVVGGGNTAAEEALYLANLARSVTLIHRRDALRADGILQERLFNNDKINILWNHQLIQIEGDDAPRSLKRLILQDSLAGTEKILEMDGLFVAIGHQPETELVKGQIAMTKAGYIRHEPDSTRTSIAGVFAAGDVTDDIYRQAVTAAGMGCMAALEAERFLSAENTSAVKIAV